MDGEIEFIPLHHDSQPVKRFMSKLYLELVLNFNLSTKSKMSPTIPSVFSKSVICLYFKSRGNKMLGVLLLGR